MKLTDLAAVGLRGWRKKTNRLYSVASEYFDAEYYLASYPDVQEAGIDPLRHYIKYGLAEGRSPSPTFSAADIHERLAGVLGGHFSAGNIQDTSTMKEGANSILAVFQQEHMKSKVAEAMQLEPMIGQPAQLPKTTSVQINEQGQSVSGKALRTHFAGRQFKHVILTAHVRMSGAARVTAAFCNAMSQIENPADVLLVTTDGSDFEFPQWFPHGIERFDLSRYLEGFGPEHRMKLLYDLLRGLNCRHVVNINSRLMWDCHQAYGRQLAQEFQLTTYMFTWDENPLGDPVGYPIQWLRHSIDHQQLLLTDNENLARNIATRFNLNAQVGETLFSLRSPVQFRPDLREAANRAANKRATLDRPRVLWAGRFDRQKRVDILVAIAEAMPEADFHVFGKPVLDRKSLAEYHPPRNVFDMGPYSDFCDVLQNGYSAYLYTSQWDGIPTILLDVASGGLPIVASDVGGISEVIDDQTGWLIDPFQDVDQYCAALRYILANPEEAANRTSALTAKVEQDFGAKQYVTHVKEALRCHEL